MSLPINSCPKEFLEIQNSSKKNKHAPVALILISETLSETDRIGDYFLLLTIAKTHRVICKVIHDKNDLEPAIQSHSTDRFKLLLILAHGDRSYIEFSKPYRAKDIKPQHFDGLAPGAQIFLLTCEAGQELAQRIADLSCRTVFSSIEKLSPIDTCIAFCSSHNRLEMSSYLDGKQYCAAFKKGKKPVSCNNKEDDEYYFYGQREFLIRQAEKGNPLFQYWLGCRLEIDCCQKASQDWFRQAALNGNKEAQTIVADRYRKGNQIEQAKIWYQKAATQGDIDAQYSLSEIYQLEENLIEAKKWLQYGAQQKDPRAQADLGGVKK